MSVFGAVVAVLVLVASYVLVTSVAMLGLPLACSEGMTEVAEGTVSSVEPHVTTDTEGNQHVWFSCLVRSGGDDGREFSVWCPDWYGCLAVGATASVSYDPENPSSCMMSDMRESMPGAFHAVTRACGAIIAVGTVALVALAVAGLA